MEIFLIIIIAIIAKRGKGIAEKSRITPVVDYHLD